ncbi:MAG: ComEC/Rec2 family competence protein [Pyrinomonadaceae bacterium MAG19_C2-C3]|nr:ComEC/Rec2 family competence protein [Pyrinomonadaceae bacterium MAG19_C2-C3]
MEAANNSNAVFSARPLGVAAICFALGILAAKYVPLSLWGLIVGGVAALVASVYAARGGRNGHAHIAAYLILVSVACAGAGLMLIKGCECLRADRVCGLFVRGVIESDTVVELTGTLARAPEAAPDGVSLLLDTEVLRFRETDYRVKGRVRLYAVIDDEGTAAAYRDLRLTYGARLRVAVRLRREEEFRNPGVVSYTELLERQGIDATATIKSFLLVERLEDEAMSFAPLRWIYEMRSRIIGLANRTFEPDTAAVFNASMLGNENYLSRAVAERYRIGGTFHVLVISGMHIGIIGGLVLWLMRRMTGRRVWQWAGAIVFVWLFAIAVGAESSVIRAALMFSIIGLALALNRSPASLDAMNTLGAAALALLVWRPDDLFSPSFQLTFLAVFAMLAVAIPVLTKLRRIGQWRPTTATPRPPRCSPMWRTIGESLFWSERAWREEQATMIWRYRLIKTPLAAWLERRRVQRLARYVFAAIVISGSVQIVMLPLMVLYFHRFSFAAFVLNIWTGFAFIVMSAAGIVALIIAEVSTPFASPFVWLTEAMSSVATYGVDPFVRLGITGFRVPEYHGWQWFVYPLYFVPLVVLIARLKSWDAVRQTIDDERPRKWYETRRVTAASCVMLILFGVTILAHPYSADIKADVLRVDFLDVGQGDAALVTLPDGTTMLVDGGGRVGFSRRTQRTNDKASDTDDDNNDVAPDFEPDTPRIGEAVVSEYLWWRGLDRVDYLVATHADADHIEGLSDVARNFNVRAAFVGRTPSRDAEYRAFAETLARENVPVEVLNAGDRLRFGEATIEVENPRALTDLTINRVASSNNDSLVLRVRYGERSILLTADIEAATEARLVRDMANLRSDVIKVAHHGSRTSSTEAFVEKVAPALAVISVGQRSPYNHPAAEVVERWQRHGGRVMTTGTHGTISVITNGRDLNVETFIER